MNHFRLKYINPHRAPEYLTPDQQKKPVRRSKLAFQEMRHAAQEADAETAEAEYHARLGKK